MEIRLWIPGDPIQLNRPRACAVPNKRGANRPYRARVYSDQEDAMEKYKLELMRRLPVGHSAIQGPCVLDCRFYFTVPKSASKKRQAAMISGAEYHCHKPDGSNLLKWVEDCGNGILWRDDKQIVRASFVKVYGVAPGTEIMVQDV